MPRLPKTILLCCAVLLALGTVAACKQADPEELATQAMARQFIEEVYVRTNADAAEALLGPFDTYGYVTREIIDETIAGQKQKGCVTADNVSAGKPGGDVRIPPVTDGDRAKGIEARTAWAVASNYACGGARTSRISVVFLEKVNGKWGISKVSFQTGLGETNP